MACRFPAQQFGQLTSHIYNQNLLNCAETGNDNFLEASLITRRKLTGFKGAPQWTIFNVHTAFRNENIAAGFTAIRFTSGHATKNTLVFNYRYRASFSRKKYLQLGLSGSIENETMNWKDVIANDTDDPVLFPQVSHSFRPNIGVAFHMVYNSFYGGMSIPTFFNFFGSESKVELGRNVRINSHIGYKIVDNSDVKLKAELFSRSYGISKFLLESTVHASIREILEVGVGYRSNNSYFAIVGAGLNERLRFSYSFDVFRTYFIATPVYYQEINLRYALVYKNKAKNTSFL
jgi:type IX secretion system PorP/SprF family membrane protein